MPRPKFAPDIKLADLTAEDVLCPDCGYNLRDIEEGRCPECGYEYTAESIRESQVPWMQRKSIGWFRSIRLTAKMDPKRLAYDICRQQSLREAKAFHRSLLFMTAGVAALLCVAAAIGESNPHWVRRWFTNACGFWVTIAIVPPLAAGMLRDVGGDRERQDRTKAVAIYICARLHELWVAGFCLLVGSVCVNASAPATIAAAIIGIAVGVMFGAITYLGWLSNVVWMVGIVGNHRWLGRQLVSLAIVVTVAAVFAIANIVATMIEGRFL